MKKLLLSVVGLFVFLSTVQARDGSWGTLGEYGMQKLWKSSDTCSNDTLQKIATGAVVIGIVQISSPGINSSIWFQHWTTTTGASPTTHEFSVFGATVPKYNMSQSTGMATSHDAQSNAIYFMDRSTMGWVYTTKGDKPACLRIRWDYLDSPGVGQ